MKITSFQLNCYLALTVIIIGCSLDVATTAGFALVFIAMVSIVGAVFPFIFEDLF